MLKALDDLPTDQKEVIVLGVFQDLSYAEMEEITGTKAVTLRSRMFHGLKKLARLMGGEEVVAEIEGRRVRHRVFHIDTDVPMTNDE